MARPERNTIDYFPFICEDGKKMFYIEETYGNDGFATFIKILRELSKTEYHYLDLSKNTTLMFMSAKCKVSKDILLAIINDLVELNKFNRALWEENRIIWCQDFINSIKDAYKKRNNECITLEGLLNLLEGLGVLKRSKGSITAPVKPQSKVEYIKEDKSIVKEDILKISESMWESHKNNFLKDGKWAFKFCNDKNLKLVDFDKQIKDFISDIELKEDYKPTQELKSHFTNLFNKKNKLGAHTIPEQPKIKISV